MLFCKEYLEQNYETSVLDYKITLPEDAQIAKCDYMKAAGSGITRHVLLETFVFCNVHFSS
jgi:hypothetical protein